MGIEEQISDIEEYLRVRQTYIMVDGKKQYQPHYTAERLNAMETRLDDIEAKLSEIIAAINTGRRLLTD
ncbi:hypothetical protein LCGC14_1032360 [marine sediment metagenome]|uniref:Uncharacterized protein n=1 Tax=marine sediment metagenome TaxID=412755 RepID=A0A0F9MU84_9ZZZZ